MKTRAPVSLLSVAVIIGFTAGVISSLYHIASHRYISYKMFKLIALTFQKNINADIICAAVALTVLYLLLSRLVKKGVIGRDRLLQFAVMVFVGLAVFAAVNGCLKKFTSFTIRSITYYLIIKAGNVIGGIISFEHFLETLAQCAVPVGLLAGGVVVILFSFWLLRKVRWEVMFTIARAKWVKGVGLALFVITVLLNLWIVVGRKVHGGEGPNVVLIIVDTLRADHLGCYGYHRNTSPHINALSEDSVLFKNAISAAPWTAPSIGSVLTSRYPVILGYKGYNQIRIDDRFVLLPEIFKNNCYYTKGIISNTHLSYRAGFNQGFDSYDEDNSRDELHVSSPSITRKAVSFLKKHRDDKFFLFLHYFDPHYSFILHPEYDYFPDYKGYLRSGQTIIKLREKAPHLSKSDVDYVRALYDSEINFTDEHIGRIVGALKELGLYDDTLLVFTADHGEEFMERGDYWIGHGDKLYQEQIHVPLLIKLPGAPGPGIVEEHVGLIDLMPTIVELAGLKLPDGYGFQGEMVKLAGEEDARGKPIFSETRYSATLQSVVWNGWKLIHDPDINIRQLFNLRNDPAETEDVAEKNEELLRDMSGMLQQWSDRMKSGAASSKVTTKADFTVEQEINLRALGYIQ